MTMQSNPALDTPSGSFETAHSVTRALFVVTVIVYAILLLVSFPQLADPLIRHDDFPAFFGEEHLFYEKTLAEGRWLNYWWIARPFTWSATTNFLVYQLAWALFAAAVALNALGPARGLFPKVALGAIVALGPQAFLISSWFNTLLAGSWVVAIFAVTSLYVSARVSRGLFLIFAPVSMMAYSTYPLLMIVLCLTRFGARRSLLNLVGLVILLGAGIALGMVLMYAINYHVHGVFGIEIADWRAPNPATSLETFWANAERLMPLFAERLLSSWAYGIPALGVVNIALLLVALRVLMRRQGYLALYILTGIAATIGLVVLHGLQSGVEVPMRAVAAAWVFFAVGLVKATADGAFDGRETAIKVGLIVLIAVYGGQILKTTQGFMLWQTTTRDMALSLPREAKAVFIYGKMENIPGFDGAQINHPLALTDRIRKFIGVRVFACNMVRGDICEDTPPFDLSVPDAEMRVKMVGPHAVVALPG